MAESKQSVNLPTDLVSKIQTAYIEKRGSARGAIQEVLLRGAELALAELLGENKNERILAETDKPLYTFENIASAEKKIMAATEQLSGALQDIKQAIHPQNEHDIHGSSSQSSPSEFEQIIRDSEQTFKNGVSEFDQHAEDFRKATTGNPTRKRSGSR